MMKKKHQITIASSVIIGLATVIAAFVASSGNSEQTSGGSSSSASESATRSTTGPTATAGPEDDSKLGVTAANRCNAEWVEFDYPEWGPDKQDTGLNEGWRGGKPDGDGGVGEEQYYMRSRYAYASEEQGWNQSNTTAEWKLGHLSGIYDIEAYVPPDHATATASYHLYRGDDRLATAEINQQRDKGWVDLWDSIELEQSVYAYSIRLRYFDSKPSTDIGGPAGRSIAIDAVRIRCLEAN